jgi:autotransporter-associated beta strand protein
VIFLLLLLAGILMSSDSAFSQSTFTWNGGNGSWTSPGNWTISGNATGYPDEAGDMVSFTNNSGTYDVSTTTAGNGTAVVGSITTNGAGTVRLGNSTTFAGSLSLNSTSGAPILSVNTGRLAIFTELVGSQGFRKTGNGILNFNTNTLDMNNLTGDVSIEDGTVWFNQAGNFGSGNLSFSGSNTIFQMRALSTTTFAANRTLTISSGSNITFQNFNAASSAMVIDGTIAGSGNLTFSNGNFTLNGANTHSGATTLSASGSTASVNLSLAAGSFLSSSTLSFTSLGNASLDLGANSQTISNLITESSNAGSAMSISNGSLTISGGGDISLGGRGGAFTLSLAGLTAFTAGSASSNLTFQSGDSSGTTTNTLILSTNGTNTLVGQTVLFGRTNAGGNATGAAYSANVNLGTNNTIHADVFKVGSTNSTAALAFQSGLSNPSLVLRSANGTAAVREWTVGEVTVDTGGRSGQGTVDLLGGTLNALVGNLTVGLNNNASLTSTSWLKMSNGTLTADTIRLATKSGASTGGLSGAIYQSGGNVSTQTLEFGQSGTGNSTITALYEISGGRLEAGMIQAGGGNFTSSSNRTLAVSGNATLSNISGANLTITGASSASGGLMNLNISGGAELLTSNGDITFGTDTLLIGSGSLTKNGTGNLILAGASNFAGTTTINSGTLVLASDQTLGAIAGSGHISLSNATLTSNSSSSTDFSGVISGSGGLTKSGVSNLSLSGANSYTGTTTILNGTLLLGQIQALPESALALGGGTLNLGGNTQLVTSLTTVSGGSGNATVTGGGLIINSSASNTITGLSNGSNLDFSGLTSLTFNGSSSEFAVQAGSNSSSTPSGFILSTSGTNTITANQTRFGGAATTASNKLNVALGKTNNIFTDSLTIGYSHSDDTAAVVSMSFQAASSNATLKLRSSNGTGALPTWIIGHTLGITKAGSGIVDLSGGTLDAEVSDLIIGRHSATTAIADTSSLTMSAGSLTVERMILGEKTSVGSVALTSTFTQSGGEVVARNLTLGKGGNSTSAQFIPTYNLTGGNLSAETISAGAGIFNNSTSSRTLNIASATLRNISGSNLTITGTDATTGGRVNLTISGNAILESGAGQHITMGAHTLLGGSGNLTKTGTGDLILNSNLNHSYSGTANINAGRLLVYSSNMTSATINLNGGTFTGNTTVAGIRISSNTVFDIAEGNRISANTTFSGSQAFSKNGTGELAIGNGGSQTYNGTATLNAGRLTLNSNMSSTSLIVHSGIVSGNGTVGPITLNGDSQFDISSNQTITASSTFSGNANFSKTGTGSLSISNANAYSGTVTLSTGNLTIGSDMTNATLTLAGGTLGGNGTIGAVILASNSTFNVANSSRLVIGSSGSLSGSANLIKSGNGTLAINASTDQTYSGTMTLNGGNFIVNSNLSSAGTTTVNASTATLAGSGSLGNVTLTRGILSPGEGAVGTLSVKTFTWSANGTMKFDLSSDSTASDQLAIIGNFSRSGTGNFTFNLVGGQEATTYTLVTWTGTTTFTTANFFSTGQTGNFSISSNQLQFTTVPEPGTVGFVLLAATGIFLWRRVRKSHQTGARIQKKSNHC